MNNNVIKIVTLICLGVFVVFGIISAVIFGTMFTKGDSKGINFSFNGFGGEEFSIDFDESYNLDDVSKIKINVVSSNIDIYNSAETADVVFQGNGRARSELVELIVEEKPDMLYIYVKYPKFGNVWFMDSQLSLGIPADYTGEIEIDTVSGSIDISHLDNDLDALIINTTSGDTSAYVKSISSLDIDTTSGDHIINSVITENVKVNSVSGEFYIDGISESVKKIDIDTTSGDVAVIYDVPCETKVNSVSGNIELLFGTTEGMTLDFDSVSGDVEGSYSTTKGGTLIKVDTTSGDLTIQ